MWYAVSKNRNKFAKSANLGYWHGLFIEKKPVVGTTKPIKLQTLIVVCRTLPVSKN